MKMPLRLRLLGEFEVTRDGQPVVLPPSKKTRALLAYLAATGRAHRRERLCALFWEIPDDPRGALRWSLSRLRALIDDPGATRIIATRETVAFAPAGAEIDLAKLRAMLTAGMDGLGTDALETAASLFRGEFLEGLDLPDAHEFHTWCLAEREDLRNVQIKLLETLLKRLAGEPAAALRHARTLTQVNPFNERARIALLRLLIQLGRHGEAERHFDTAVRLFRELGPRAEEPLVRAWHDLIRHAKAASPAPESPPVPLIVPSPPPPSASRKERTEQPPIIGRGAEFARLRALFERSRAKGEIAIALITGEPGLGKSCLVDEFLKSAREEGMQPLIGHAYETGLDDPYRPWSEALGTFAPAASRDEAPASRRSREARDAFFASVAKRIFPDGPKEEPVLLAFEDVHWWDEASADLFDFVIRAGRRRPVLVILTAREGELPDNPAVARVLRRLRHERIIEEIALKPLTPAESEALARAIAPEIDPERVVLGSGGNPLFALELIRNAALHPDDLPRTVKDLIRDRVDRLADETADVLRWASVLGPQFPAKHLALAASLALDALIAAFETLERHRFLRASDSAGSDVYEFAHHLVQQAIYTSLSEPRRRLMHLKIARALQASEGGLKRWAVEIAHHAASAGEPGMAATGCVAAGRQCLRLFANAEAESLARRGMRYAEKLGDIERVQRMIELVQIEVSARRPADLKGAMQRVEALANEALDQGSIEHARLGFHMLAYLRWEEGLWSSAKRDMLRAELVSRSADERERMIAMGEAARCLALLERDLPQAESLMLEASALARRQNMESSAILDAHGMLRRHQGLYDEAAAHFEQARHIARRDGAHESEFLALEHWATMEVQRRRLKDAEILCAELRHLGERLRSGSEAPYARALDAACRVLQGERAAQADLEREAAALRLADAKHRLTLILLLSAEAAMKADDRGSAKSAAAEALALAEIMERQSEIAHCRALLLRLACEEGDADAMAEHGNALDKLMTAPLSHLARQCAETALAGCAAMRKARSAPRQPASRKAKTL